MILTVIIVVKRRNKIDIMRMEVEKDPSGKRVKRSETFLKIIIHQKDLNFPSWPESDLRISCFTFSVRAIE